MGTETRTRLALLALAGALSMGHGWQTGSSSSSSTSGGGTPAATLAELASCFSAAVASGETERRCVYTGGNPDGAGAYVAVQHPTTAGAAYASDETAFVAGSSALALVAPDIPWGFRLEADLGGANVELCGIDADCGSSANGTDALHVSAIELDLSNVDCGSGNANGQEIIISRLNMFHQAAMKRRHRDIAITGTSSTECTVTLRDSNIGFNHGSNGAVWPTIETWAPVTLIIEHSTVRALDLVAGAPLTSMNMGGSVGGRGITLRGSSLIGDLAEPCVVRKNVTATGTHFNVILDDSAGHRNAEDSWSVISTCDVAFLDTEPASLGFYSVGSVRLQGLFSAIYRTAKTATTASPHNWIRNHVNLEATVTTFLDVPDQTTDQGQLDLEIIGDPSLYAMVSIVRATGTTTSVLRGLNVRTSIGTGVNTPHSCSTFFNSTQQAAVTATGLLDALVTSIDKRLRFVNGVCYAAPAAATATATFSGLPSEGETITVNGIVYTFSADPTDAEYEVDIGASADGQRDALIAAINRTGTPGTNYNAGIAPHPSVRAASGGTGIVTFTARVPGSIGNALTLAEAATNTVVSGAVFTGGVDIF